MPPLIRFLIANFANGFLLGALAVLGILAVEPASLTRELLDDSPLGLALIIYAVGSSFGLGSIATALYFISEQANR